MSITNQQLIGLPVETQSGQSLGRVQGFVVDPMTHTILQYEVQRGRFLKDLLGKTLLIGTHQIVSLTEEKMVVEDLVLQEHERVKATTEAVSPT